MTSLSDHCLLVRLVSALLVADWDERPVRFGYSPTPEVAKSEDPVRFVQFNAVNAHRGTGTGSVRSIQ